MENTEGVDLSRLQQHTPSRSLHLSLFDLMRYVSVGTDELRLYLLKETHVILECRACSNLFRDVPYLVAHKRFYCKQKCDFSLQNYGNSQDPPQGDLAAFFQAESPLNEKDFLKHSVELAKKNLQNSKVESCVRKEPTKRQFYDAVQKQLEFSQANTPPTRSYSFEPLENTDVAMKVVSNANEDFSAKQDSTECDGCASSKEFNNGSDKQDGQNNVCKKETCGEKFNNSTSSSSISSILSSDNKSEATSSKPNLRSSSSEYRTYPCFKCNTAMTSQKANPDNSQGGHPDDSQGHSCGDSKNVTPFVGLSQQKINGMQNKVRKTDWLKPKGCISTIEKVGAKPPTVNNAAKEALEAKKKNQANLQALKEEQIAYENEILQQKLIRGIIPKSSRGRKKFRCESCGKIFSKMDSLRDHLRDCIDWEHVSQPIRNLKLPLPTVTEANVPSLPMSAPASVDWPDTGSEELPKPPMSGPQFRPQVSKTETLHTNTISSKSSVRLQDKLPIKLPDLNGVKKNVIENPIRGQVLVMNPKIIKQNEVILLPLSSTDATNTPSSSKTSSPVEAYPKSTRSNETSLVKPPPLLAIHLRTNHNPGNKSSELSMTSRNLQTVSPANRGSLNGPIQNEVKDIEIIAVNSPNINSNNINYNNNKDKTPESLHNRQQSTIVSMNVTSSNKQVNSSRCNCLQCEAGIVNLDNPVKDSSPPVPSSTACRGCIECQKSSICSSACCVNDVEIVEQFTSLPPEGTSGKFSMPNCDYQQEIPMNDTDDVIITSHNFSRRETSLLSTNEKGPTNTQILKKNPNNPDECVLVSISNQTAQIPDSNVGVQRPPYLDDVATATNLKITNCRSLIKPVIWKQYKCRLCVFSHKNFFECKSHLKKKHAQKIRTCNVQCMNYYIVDLKCRDKKRPCCLFPRKNCRQLLDPKPNPVTLAESYGPEKIAPQINRVSSLPSKKCATNTQSTKTWSKLDKKDLEHLMDTKNLLCLECKRKFQNVYNLQRHVVRHLGKKDFQCKCCSRQMYTSSECRSHIKRQHLGKIKGITLKTLDRFIIGLNNTRDFSDSVKNCSLVNATVPLSSASVEFDSKVPVPKSLPNAAAQLSMLSTRKSSYEKKGFVFKCNPKPTKKSIKK